MDASNGTLWINPEYEKLLRAHGLADLRALMTAPGAGSLTKPGLARWRERLRLELDSPGGAVRLYLKRFCRPPWQVQWRRCLAGFRSFAEQEWYWLQRAAALDIAVPTPVACGTSGGWLTERYSCLLLAAVPGQQLETWVPRCSAALQRGARRSLSMDLARMVRRLHSAGLFHRDLYLGHIFVSEHDNGAWKLFLIDLQRVIAPRWRQRRWAVKDLAALNFSSPMPEISARERLRWLKHYLGVRRLQAADRRLIREVEAKTERMARHQERVRP